MGPYVGSLPFLLISLFWGTTAMVARDHTQVYDTTLEEAAKKTRLP